MKKVTVHALLVCTAFVCLFASFGCREKKKGGEPIVVDTTQVGTNAVKNTIVETPENMMVLIHKVANYEQWKMAYEAHDPVRLTYGLHNYIIGRDLYDSNRVLVALKAEDMAKAKAFAASAELKKAMHNAGVSGPVEQYYFVATWRDTAQLGPFPRSMTTLTIKDWDVWMKHFKEGQQERMDNGIITRLIGHDADNKNKVAVVTALADTAKAFAYYRSDALKKRMEAGGVVGTPKRFLFRIAVRY